MIGAEIFRCGYEWDCDEESITASWRADEDDNDELPENVVERCDYVGMQMDSADLSNCSVDANIELNVPVKHVRWNYPFEVERGSYNVYPIEEAHTWGELLARIVDVFQEEYDKHESEMAHELGDYIIEQMEIHPNGMVTVSFGS